MTADAPADARPGTRAAAAARVAARIRARIGDGEPDGAIILGSGLGGLGSRVEDAVRIAFAEIAGFPGVSVAGHAGTLIAGRLAGRRVVALAGRLHVYEGHAAAVAAFPIRVLHALGVRTALLSNAAGGIRRTFRAGDLMAIADHLNLMGGSPLVGALEPGDERFPDMSRAYDPHLRRHLQDAALATGVSLVEGTYAGVTGPSYETPAEVRMLARFGADAVGMSTVPEVIVANALGMRVAGVSCITNLASGVSSHPQSHDDVLAVAARVADRFERLVLEFVARAFEPAGPPGGRRPPATRSG